jgi:N-methylhydantoinase A
MHAVENGKELADFTMIAFGGAAPLHAARLCEKLGITTLIVPPGAGVGSAVGFLRAPFGFEAVRSAHVRLSRFNPARVNTVLKDLADEAIPFVTAGAPGVTPECRCVAYMRYVGQGWEIPVSIDLRDYSPEDRELFEGLFIEAYARFFGRPIEGLDIEVVSWSLRATSPQPPVDRATLNGATADAVADLRRQIIAPETATFADAAVVARAGMQPGDRVAGPAAIIEKETTTILTSRFEAVMQSDGCLVVRAVSLQGSAA